MKVVLILKEEMDSCSDNNSSHSLPNLVHSCYEYFPSPPPEQEEFVDRFVLIVNSEKLSQATKKLEEFAVNMKLSDRWTIYGLMGIIGFISSRIDFILTEKLMKSARKIVPRISVYEFLKNRRHRETDEEEVIFRIWERTMYSKTFISDDDDGNEKWVKAHSFADSILSRNPVRRTILFSASTNVTIVGTLPPHPHYH